MKHSSQKRDQIKLGQRSGLQKFFDGLRRVVANRYLNVGIGIILIVVSGDEAWSSLSEGFHKSSFDANFGMVLIGLIHILKTLPDLVEGVQHLAAEDDSLDP